MKKKLLKKSIWQSVLSIFVFSIFVYFAIGSFPGVNQQSRYLGDGVYETAKTYSSGKVEVLKGEHDDKGRWQGLIFIETTDGFDLQFIERVTMVGGLRHGRSTIAYPGGKELNYCYNMGERVSCNKSANMGTSDTTAFKILNYKYPWFMVTLNVFGFNDEYIEAYMDTLESVLYSNEFEEEDFFDNYDDVISELEETPYDSIVNGNNLILLYNALENMKNGEFRLATIDHLRADNTGTYQILQTIYPGYISGLNEAEVSDNDLETFCLLFDNILESYGALDLEDPFFPDSADTRMFRAMDSISSTEKSSPIFSALKSAAINNINSFKSYPNNINPNLKKLILDTSPKDIATLVQISIFYYFVSSDVLRNVTWDAYVIKNGVISLPTVTTEFSGNNTATSATIQGHVIKDGNNSVTTKGIVWASFYNPTINDNVESRGNGTLPFSATLEGLTEGETYYARAFATNSAGTAYGNCINFVAKNTTGIDNSKISELDFNVYPNPASSTATFSFQSKSTENLVLIVVDLNGKIVLSKELSNIPSGKNQVQLNVTELQNGIYNCMLTNNSTIKVNRKLLIAH